MNNKGYMTIEASFIIPIILLGMFMCIFALLLIYEKGIMYEKEYSSIYSVPINNIKNDSVNEYLSTRDYTGNILFGTASVDTFCMNHKAVCCGKLEWHGVNEICSSHEIDVRTDRLRRWQFYGDIVDQQEE